MTLQKFGISVSATQLSVSSHTQDKSSFSVFSSLASLITVPCQELVVKLSAFPSPLHFFAPKQPNLLLAIQVLYGSAYIHSVLSSCPALFFIDESLDTAFIYLLCPEALLLCACP